jgi:DNA-binding SARP family transcriptional activator
MDLPSPRSARDPTAETLHLRLLGRPQWRAGQASAVGGNHDLSRKDAALLALLAIDGAQARDVLAGRLWPDVAADKASGSLRQRIARLRRDTGHRLLHTGDSLHLAEGVICDATAVAAMSTEQLLSAGEFLAGFDYGDHQFLDAWVQTLRDRTRRERADALTGHVADLEQRGKLAAALRLNEHVLALMPLQEHAWRRQMRLHYLRGDRSAAIDAFERFEAVLRDETGARPSEETRALLRTIESAQAAPRPSRTLVPASLVRPPVLIGRAHEWHAMDQAWACGRAFVLIGDAGMGKSRLLEDFVHGRAGVVQEPARPGDAQTPYAVLARLLRAVLRHHSPGLDDFTRRELARILPDIGPAPPAPGQQASLWQAIERLLGQALATGLSALVIDDLHYADAATLEALRWLSSSPSLASLRFGLASRPVDEGPLSAGLRAWFDDSHRPERIVLGILSDADIGALLEAIDLPHLASAGLADKLFRHAGGHPMFTLETLKAITATAPEPGDAMPQPATVHTLLEHRLRALPPRAVALLRVAAVCGEDLTVERAALLLGCSVLDLAEPWSDLEAAIVLQGQRFAHDLVRESALRLAPEAVQRVLHAQLARMLADDAHVPPGRVAAHWQAAEHWLEAGTGWHAAGLAARYAGRLVEQQTLLERAADCHRRAGNVAGEFDALLPCMDSLQVTVGGEAVLAELPRLEGLACTPDRQVQAMMVRTQALLGLARSDEALRVAAATADAARDHPSLLADTLCLQGMALAQCGRFDEAVTQQREAVRLAQASHDTRLALRSTNALAYVLHLAGQPQAAVRAQREGMDLARDIGDHAELALTESNLATYLSVVGEPPSTYRHALRARECYAAMGSSANSLHAGINLANLGNAAAYLGRFGEALEVLAEATRGFGEQAHPAGAAKARLALAGVWLTLACPEAARAVLFTLPLGAPPVMEAQWQLALARAAALEGQATNEPLRRAAQLLAANSALALAPALWLEWSRHGDAASVIDTLRHVRMTCEALEMHGAARALAVRQIARHIETPASEDSDHAAATTAESLLPFVAEGLHASIYPPEAWLVLALALERSGRVESGQACRSAALNWIDTQALPNIPPEHRTRFLGCNPVNVALRQAVGRSFR